MSGLGSVPEEIGQFALSLWVLISSCGKRHWVR